MMTIKKQHGRNWINCAAAMLIGTNALAFAAESPQASGNVTVFATGLNNPRGLKFGPDGNLYVAEGGVGGSDSTEGCCEQAGPEVGPYSGSATGARISRIDSQGSRVTLVDNLPSTQSNPMTGGSVSGVADVAFLGNELYALLSGAGCSHGVAQLPSRPNAVLRINGDGSTTLVANLSAFLMANPVRNPEPADFEPDGTWYSMIATQGNLYAVEPNHGELDMITPQGQIERVADISAVFGHIVPTALAARNQSKFYVGNLGEFPIDPAGASKILEISKDGRVRIVADHLFTVLGLVFDHKGRLYILESMTKPGGPGADQLGSGKVLRIDKVGDHGKNSAPTVVVTGLTFPTAMTFGPDGALYLSNIGFGGGPGDGEIVKVTLPNER